MHSLLNLKQPVIAKPSGGLFDGWALSGILQFLSDFFGGAHKGVSLALDGVDVRA